MLLVPWIRYLVVGREGVVEMGYGGDVPRVTGHRTRKKGGSVVDKVGDDDFYEVLRKPGDWRRKSGAFLLGIPWSIPEGKSLDFGLVSVPDLVSE